MSIDSHCVEVGFPIRAQLCLGGEPGAAEHLLKPQEAS
jgi:hypothetical protein